MNGSTHASGQGPQCCSTCRRSSMLTTPSLVRSATPVGPPFVPHKLVTISKSSMFTKPSRLESPGQFGGGQCGSTCNDAEHVLVQPWLSVMVRSYEPPALTVIEFCIELNPLGP